MIPARHIATQEIRASESPRQSRSDCPPMRFAEFLRTTVLICGAAASALGVVTLAAVSSTVTTW